MHHLDGENLHISKLEKATVKFEDFQRLFMNKWQVGNTVMHKDMKLSYCLRDP